MDVGPDGRVYVEADGRIRRLSAEQPSESQTSFTVASDGGAEVYEFSFTGRHLRTRHALTGATLYEFDYSPAGYLTGITDGDGLTTVIERDGAGVPTAIEAPFGQRTTLTVSSDGYLATIVAPGGGTTTLTTTADGLLTAFEDANGHASTFTYTAAGRLLTDEDAGDGLQTLARVEAGTVVTTTRTTGLDRTHTYRIERLPAGDERATDTAPDGTVRTSLLRLDGQQEVTEADGTRTTTTLVPDPRFGMAAAVPATTTVRTPAGLQLTASATRTVVLTDPEDPLSLETQTETTTVNGRTTTTVFDAATRTYTTTTPAGRVSTATIDPQGRVTRTQTGTLTPVDFTYDA